MHIYEVMRSEGVHFGSHLVVAKNEENAKRKEGNMKLNAGDWIATGIDGEHWCIADDIFRRTYEEIDSE